MIAPPGWVDSRVKDSKLLSAAQREELFRVYEGDPNFIIAISTISATVIDGIGLRKAQMRAHDEVLHAVFQDGVMVIVDGTLPVAEFGLSNTHALPKADNLVPECALASIIAKVTRDKLMAELDKQYPGYGFAKHAGYGTKQHQEALHKLGPCAAHRHSYQPIREALAKMGPGFISSRAQA